MAAFILNCAGIRAIAKTDFLCTLVKMEAFLCFTDVFNKLLHVFLPALGDNYMHSSFFFRMTNIGEKSKFIGCNLHI